VSASTPLAIATIAITSTDTAWRVVRGVIEGGIIL
jgi:hypothetical protein